MATFHKMMLLSALLLLAAGSDETCPIGGRCLLPEVSDTVSKADELIDPALGFVQRALAYKRKESKTQEVAHSNSNSSQHPQVIRDLPRIHSSLSPCSLRPGLGYDFVPTATGTVTQVQAFTMLGLVNPQETCVDSTLPALTSIISGYDVQAKNRTAQWVIIIWAGIAGSLVLWSVAAVAFVPRKKERETIATPRKSALADEEGAWRIGVMHWVSLAWVDELVGRYGKCLHSVIDDKEIVNNRQDEEYKPYVTFREYWMEEVKAAGSAEKANLTRALYRTIGFKASALLVTTVVIEEFFSSIAMVWALERLLTTLEDMNAHRKMFPEIPQSYLEPTLQIVLLLWGVPMIYRTSSIVVSLLDGYYTNVCAAGLASIVFEKAMNLPVGSASLQSSTDSQDGSEASSDKPNVIQLLNVDIIEAWGYLLRDILYTALAPFTMIVLLIILVKQTRMAGAFGILYIIPAIVGILLCQLSTMSWWKRYQIFQDQRMKWLTESIIHIRTIKSLAWEKLSFEKLHGAREAELTCNQRGAIIRGGLFSVAHTLPWGTLLLALYFMLVTEGNIQAHKIVIIQRILGSLLGCIGQLISGLNKFVSVPNSFRRIKRFLDLKQRPENIIRQPDLCNPNAPVVRLRGTFTFVEDHPPVLHDLDVAIPRGELVGIIGGVASGKSAFLQAIIGELYPVDNAFIEAPMPGDGRVAYCPQVPWIFEGTLRENVIMNEALDNDRYYKSLHAACLTPDLQILPGGDQVTIGSYGIRLSGGQRARVALARAAYMEQAEVVVIDDPFASVDVPTGQHICNELLLGPIMRGRTRIVVMQPNPGRLRCFDRVLLIEKGRVVEMGPPAEVIESKAFKRLLAEGKENAGHAEDEDPREPRSRSENTAAMMVKMKANEPAISLREAEAQDHITWSTFFWWVKAAGFLNIFVFLGLIAIQKSIELRESLVIAVWIDTKMAQPQVDDRIFMIRCLVVVLAACISIVLASYASSRVSITASRALHEGVMKSILRAPVDRFFDKNPVGRLINRLSYDIRLCDDSVTLVLFAMLGFTCGFFITQSFILRVVPTKIAICSIPFYLLTGFFIYLYRGIAVPLVFHSRFSLSSLQDLQAVVLSSCVPIRANGMFGGFMMRYNHYSQSVIRSQYLIFHVCKSWVQSRVFLCFSVLTCIFAIGGLWSDMPMGTLATVITFSFSQMSEFQSISLIFTQLINVLNALQRLTKYMKIPQEAAGEFPGDPIVRFRPKVERSELLSLELRRGAEAKDVFVARRLVQNQGQDLPSLIVCVKGGPPILQATPDGLALELLNGCRLKDLAPTCQALKTLTDGYHIIAVNNVSKSAELMAQELCNPPSSLWLDLWNSNFAEGVRVQIEDLCAGYGSEKSVLHGVNLMIEPRMKVGFAGKTGCGKSTTLLCILRLLEPRSGRILIGGRDSAKIGLNTLRSMIGLVPQDPTVFEGTWRFNIDPFGEFPDGRIWEAIQCVRLMPYLRSLPDGIDTEISRDGANLSFGQRQLLSLARMVVRQPPVLLLDECTSALDPNTQEAVQKTILNHFPMTTVIAIAHRVETILDFDRIVVFNEGDIAEQGSVDEVLKIENGIFANMVKAHRKSQ